MKLPVVDLFPRRQAALFALALAVVAIPYLGLMAVGAYVLWQSGWFWAYAGATTAVTALFFVVSRSLRSRLRAKQLQSLREMVPEDWPTSEQQAYEKVEAIAREAEAGELTVQSFEAFQELVLRLVRVVAEHYHPDQPDAYLRVPATHILKALENVAKELRAILQANVPGSHALTLRDWVKLRELWDISQIAYTLYRIVMVFVSPANSIWRELQRYFTGQTLQLTLEEMKRECLAFVVRRLGVHLIEMYSGRLVLEEDEFEHERRGRETQEWQTAEPEVPSEKRPLEFIRLLVVGQWKAGKSSLVNALCESWRATTDVLPCTNGIARYRLTPATEGGAEKTGSRSDLPGGVIVVDTPGYEAGRMEEAVPVLNTELEQADLVLLVCSASQAARQADVKFLRFFLKFFHERPQWKQPPLLVACTFIDDLRPRHEWNPPYNWSAPPEASAKSPKEHSIRMCVEAIRRQLGLSENQPIIPVCTHPERLYNVRESLIPAIRDLWSEARAVRKNRLVREHTRGRGRLLGQQIKNAVSLALRFAPRLAKRLLVAAWPRVVFALTKRFSTHLVTDILGDKRQ